MRWYEYEIRIDPGKRIVNAVTAPMYPTMDTHTCFLRQRHGRSSALFHTPYYMAESGIEGFMKTETGYRLYLDGLPDCELIFTLSLEENPRAPPFLEKACFSLAPLLWYLLLYLYLCLLQAGSKNFFKV